MSQNRISVRLGARTGPCRRSSGSGIRIMSDSLIAFQPAIDEPSNMMPSAKLSSSTVETCWAVCCHLPRGSVKRKSTYSTLCSLIISMTLETAALSAWLSGLLRHPSVTVPCACPRPVSPDRRVAPSPRLPKGRRGRAAAGRGASCPCAPPALPEHAGARPRRRPVRRCGCGSPPGSPRRRSCRRRCGRCGRPA